MRSSVIKVAAIVILLIVLLYPIAESLDTWDGAGPSNDTELGLVGLAIAAGILLALRLLSPSNLRFVMSQSDGATCAPSVDLVVVPAQFAFQSSPPSTCLRI